MPTVVIEDPVLNSPFSEPTRHFKFDDKRWRYGAPPAGNAIFAWGQHFIHHLTRAWLVGYVLASGH